MTIHPDPFKNLTKLLALKKYEVPPPGYFQNFSDKVIARIEAGEGRGYASWLDRLGLFAGFRPAMMYATGLFLSAAFLVGVVVSFNMGQTTVTAGPQHAMQVFEVSGNGLTMDAPRLGPVEHPDEIPASTAPVSVVAPSSPFNQLALNAQRVGWAMH